MGDIARRLRLLNTILVFCIALIVLTKNQTVIYSQSWIEGKLIDIVASTQQIISNIKYSFVHFVDNYFLNVSASKENVQLKREVELLRSEIFNLEEIKRENLRLKELLAFGEEVKGQKVLAQVVSWDISSDLKVLRISKGASSGIRLRDAVITSQGLVGHVLRLSENFADVLTILDMSSRVDAIFMQSRGKGIVEGLSQNRCVVKYIAHDETIALGDYVITSGIGDLYPKGIKIGEVVRIEKEIFGVSQYVEITPTVNFQSLEEVVVLINGNKIFADQFDWHYLNRDLQ